MDGIDAYYIFVGLAFFGIAYKCGINFHTCMIAMCMLPILVMIKLFVNEETNEVVARILEVFIGTLVLYIVFFSVVRVLTFMMNLIASLAVLLIGFLSIGIIILAIIIFLVIKASK